MKIDIEIIKYIDVDIEDIIKVHSLNRNSSEKEIRNAVKKYMYENITKKGQALGECWNFYGTHIDIICQQVMGTIIAQERKKSA